MPIYEYQCKACEKVSDFLQKMSDDPMITCPECGEKALKKLISAPRFRLAGSGWYETDFKEGDNKRNLVSSDTESKAKSSESTKETKSDANIDKSSSKSETKTKPTESKTETRSTTSTKKDDGKAA